VIVCWGDSLTAPQRQDGYKQKIKDLLSPIHEFDKSYPSQMVNMLPDSFEVVNCGVGGENTLTIMARQGGAPMLLAHDVTVYKRNPVVIGNRDIAAFVSSWDTTQNVKPLIQGYQEKCGSHINPAYIGEKSVAFDSDNASFWYDKNKEKFFFEYTYRLKINRPQSNDMGENVYDTLRAGTPIVTDAMRRYRNAWCNVFFMGQNGGYRDAKDLIAQFKAMIRYSQCNRYIIVSHHVTNGVELSVERMKEVEDSLQIAFGENYINLREELVRNGLQLANLTATQEDKNCIKEGKVPPQLLVDGCHFTAKGYKVVAHLVADRIKKLYIN
jgi:hypothetical protein